MHRKAMIGYLRLGAIGVLLLAVILVLTLSPTSMATGSTNSTDAITNLTIYDDTDSATKYEHNNIVFYANYSNGTSGDELSTGACNITFNISGGWTSVAAMAYSGTSQLFEYTKNFTEHGTFNWNVTCFNVTDYDELTINDTFNVIQDTTAPTLVNATPPNSSYVSGTATQLFQVVISDSGSDVNLSTGKVYYRQSGAPTWSSESLSCHGSASPYTCNKTVDLTGLADSVIQFYFNASDNIGNIGSNGSTASPLTTRIDRVAPTQPVITTPTNTSYGSTNVSLIYTTSDASSGVDDCQYELNDGNNQTVSGCVNTTFNASAGANWIKLWVNDTVNNTNVSSLVYFTVDATAPTVSISAPANASYGDTNVTLQFTATDANNISACQYELNGNSNVTIVDCDNTTFTATAGSNTIEVWANDTLGNWGSASALFTIDTTGPTVTISAPANASYGNTNVTLTFTATDANNVSVCQYELNGDSNVTIVDCDNTTFTAVAGTNTIEVWANDTLGNWDSSSVSFTVETTAPTVTISAPANASYGNTNVTLTFSAWDINNISVCRYELNDGSNVTIDDCDNTTFTAVAGANWIKVWANDTFNNWAASSLTYFTIDNIAPTVIITAPGNATYNSTNVTLEFTAIDANNITTCWYELNDGSNVTIVDCDNTTFTALSDGAGNNSIKVWVNDTFGNWGVSDYTYFTVDNVAPILTLTLPTNKTYNSNASLELTYSVNDGNLDKIWYKIDSGSNVFITDNATFNVSEGSHILYLYANDTGGSVNTTSVGFTSDVTDPSLSSSTPANNSYITGSSTQLFQIILTEAGANDTALVYYRQSGAPTWSNSSLTCYGSASPYTCNTTVDLSGKAESDIQFYFWANDTAGNTGDHGSSSGPLTTTIDRTAPIITVDAPTNTSYGSTNVSLNFVVTDSSSGVDTCYYELNDGSNVTIVDCDNTTFTALAGGNQIKVWVNDSVNNWNVTSLVYFTIDTTGPTVTISAPANASYGSTNVSLNYVAVDANNISSCRYEYNGSNTTLSGCANTTFLVDSGSNTVEVWANDTLGNWGSSSVSFTVETTAPTVTISAPANASYGNTNVTLTFSAWDINNISACRYELNDGSNVTIDDCDNTTFTAQAGANWIKVWANDTFDNWGVSSLTYFTIDNIAPTVTITAPANASYGNTNVTLEFTATDANNISACRYELNDGSNVTIVNCDNTTFTASAGGNQIKVWVNDTFNNWAASSLTYFTIDNIAPTVTITAPANASYGDTNVTLEFTATDANNISACQYELNGDSNVTIVNCDNTTFTAVADNNTIEVWVNDTLGNWGSDSVSFTVDTTGPTVTIDAPANATYYSTNITLNYVAVDANNISSCKYEFGGSNTTLTDCANTTFLANAGSNTVEVWANDTFNNWDSTSVSFTVDTTGPTVTIDAPANASYGSTNVSLNYVAVDANNISSCRYEYNGSNTTLSGCANTTFLADSGSNTVEVWANDTFNNWDSTSVSFTVDTTGPTVAITSPTNTTYESLNITLTFTVVDANNVSVCQYELNGASNQTIDNCDNITFTATAGTNIIEVWANDTFDNWGSTSVSFTATQPYYNRSEVDQLISDLNTSLRSYTDTEVSNLNTSVRSYTDTEISNLNVSINTTINALNSSLRDYTDTEISSLNTSVRSYTDTEVSNLNSSLITYIDTAIANNISSLNTTLTDYLNTEISNLNSSLRTHVGTEIGNLNSSLRTYTDTEIGNLNSTLRTYIDSEIASLQAQIDALQVPVIVGHTPNGTVTSTPATLSVTTDKAANCSYSTWSQGLLNYSDMTAFDNTDGTNHSTDISGSVENGFNVYFVKCKANTAAMSSAEYIIFKVNLWNATYNLTVPSIVGYDNTPTLFGTGWNDFRLPNYILDDRDADGTSDHNESQRNVTTVLASIEGNYEWLIYHNGSSWYTYGPGRATNDLTYFNDTTSRDFYIYMNTTDRIELN